MAWKIFGGEAVPKIFQTFNSLLGGIVRKRNATIVGPSKQLVGEFPAVDFERLYQYYHHWDQIKTSVDVMHQKFRGSGIKIESNNEYFNVFIEKWWDITNSEKKWSQFIFSLLITGSAIMELQYTPDGRMGNTEQIPMQTIFRLFRDQFGNELKIVQIVDGVFKELDPQFFIHQTINNPDRQAFGKSMFNTLASPRPITGKVDPFTGEAINPGRQSVPLLDAQAILQNAEIEIKEKMAKPRLIVGAPGMPKDQMKEVQAEMADPATDQYIWIFDKPVQSAELQIQAQGKFDEYGNNVDAHIDVGTIFASNVIKNPQGFSYSGSQTPFDVLDQRMADLQGELAETLKDRLLKPLAESWGFMDFDAMDVKITFTPTMKRLTMEDIRGLDPETVAPKEKREMYKALNIPLDDKLWDEYQNEMKEDKQDQKNIQMQSALTGAMNQPNNGEGNNENGEIGSNPFKTPPNSGGDDNNNNGQKSQTGVPKAPQTGEPKAPEKTPFESDRPKPVKTEPNPFRKPKGESLVDRLVKEVANESTLSGQEKIEAIKALERIPLPPKAGDNSNSSSDLYVSQGIDDTQGAPEISDPAIREEFGLDKDESELPPSAPSKMAKAGDKQNLNPADATGGRFTNDDNIGIDQIPTVSQDEYEAHVAGNAHQGGTGNDGINDDSDGSFKDPRDAKNDMERTPEEGNTALPNPRIGPFEEPTVDDDKAKGPDDLTMKVTGGSDALPDNTKKQILGGSDDDENPQVPSEGDPQDYDEEELKKKINSQNLGGEARIKPTPQVPPKPETVHRDIKVGEDPFTSGTDDTDVDEHLNQPQKQQARLDDAPLQEEPIKDSIGTINPSRGDTNNTAQEDPNNLANDGNDEPVIVPPFDKGSQNVGDSSQVRLQEEERTGEITDQLQPNDSRSIMDNTGLNVQPEEEYPTVTQDDYNNKLQRKVQTGENPLEEEGEPFEDGMIYKPQDIQQNDGLGETPLTPEGVTAHDQDPNTINDPTDSGIDEEEIDPNVLHLDPEIGRNYTDLTDEQGNEVPDLRFDQTQTSDEEQPEVELEYEIVTKEEYEQHLNASKGQQQDPMTQGQFDAELDSKSTDPEAPNPFEDKDEEITDPTETDEQENPQELQTMSEVPEDQNLPSAPEKSSSPQKEEGDSPNINDTPKEGGGDDDGEKEEKPKEKKSPQKKKPESSGKSTDEEPKEDSDKSSSNKEEDSKDEEEKPKRKGTVKDIIKREHELLDEGMDEDKIHLLLEEEFGEDKLEKAQETKTWKKYHKR